MLTPEDTPEERGCSALLFALVEDGHCRTVVVDDHFLSSNIEDLGEG